MIYNILQSLVPAHGFRPPLKYRSTPPNFILKITPYLRGWQNMLKPHSEQVICPCLGGHGWDRSYTMYLGTPDIKQPNYNYSKIACLNMGKELHTPTVHEFTYFLDNFKLTSLWMYYASLMVQVHPILHQTESPIPLFPQSVLVLSFHLIFLLGVVLLFV